MFSIKTSLLATLGLAMTPLALGMNNPCGPKSFGLGTHQLCYANGFNVNTCTAQTGEIWDGTCNVASVTTDGGICATKGWTNGWTTSCTGANNNPTAGTVSMIHSGNKAFTCYKADSGANCGNAPNQVRILMDVSFGSRLRR